MTPADTADTRAVRPGHRGRLHDLRAFDAWWFPRTETSLPEAMTAQNVRVDDRSDTHHIDPALHAAGRLTWQYHKYLWSMRLCRQRRLAVDVGAHVGLFAFWMARDFTDVFAFEPLEVHQRCFGLNVARANVFLQPFALGAHDGSVLLDGDQASLGGTHVTRHALDYEAGAAMTTLDSYGFETLDYLKIDVEGYEPAVLAGAEATIRRCRPVILIESPHDGPPSRYGYRAHEALETLALWGAKESVRLGHDMVLSW